MLQNLNINLYKYLPKFVWHLEFVGGQLESEISKLIVRNVKTKVVNILYKYFLNPRKLVFIFKQGLKIKFILQFALSKTKFQTVFSNTIAEVLTQTNRRELFSYS